MSYRAVLTALLLLTSTFVAHADVWDGVTISSSLNGDGTKEHPYEVASGADLKLVQSDTKYWADGIYILQIDDIDLNGHELGIIGYGHGNKTGNDIHNSNYKPFFATYDGGGHKISNLLVYWDIKKSQTTASSYASWDSDDYFHYSAGLFGLLAGTVRNLHLDKAHLTRSANAQKKNNKCDMRLGVVAGAAAPNKNGDKQVIIENIIITNSKVDDGESSLYEDGVLTDLKTYFFGGVVGDVTCGYGGTANISTGNYGYVHIRNIYADVDFDLPNTVRTINDVGSITQFDIGGIVGRMRRGKYSDLPVDVVVKGNIKAPLAAIAPYICMARCNGTNDVNGMNSAYTGEVISSNNTSNNNSYTKLSASEVTVAGTTVYPNANRFFCGYKIWDSKVGDYVEITGTYPSADDNRNGIRTLAADGTTLTVNATTEMMRSWQGVNHGSYLNLKTNIGASTATERLNSLNDPVKFAWDAANETFVFTASEQVSLARTSLHGIYATVYNDNRSTDYIYSWTLTDRKGQTSTYETTKSGAASYNNTHVGIEVSLNSCKLIIKDDFRDYTKVSMTLYGEDGHSLASAKLDLPDFNVTFKRSTETTDKVRYHFSPEFSFEDEELATDNPVISNSNLSYAWEAYTWNGSEWVIDNTAIYSGANEQEVVVKQEFIGSVRLVVTDNEISRRPYILTAHDEVDYMEQRLERMRVSFNIKQMQFDSEGYYVVAFNPATYFTGSTGYEVTYDYDDDNTSGVKIIDKDGNTHYLSAGNKRGTLEDTVTPPLIFEGTVVDQFGNVVNYDPAKYKLQWSFRIPDSRSPKTFPPGLNWSEDDGGYVRANGVYPDIDADVTGSGIDWVGEYWRGRGNTTSQFATDRWGEFAVEGGTTFKIHPNLLHCTSGFDVRAVLYDVSDGTSVETVISFSQVDINTKAVDGGYEATVAWRADDTPYTSSSPYSFKWYSNPDPTDYDGWTLVEGAGVDYISGFPTGYIDDKSRKSTITGINPTLFYKVEFRTYSGTTAEGIMGPENVIFVYDRAKTLENPNYHDFDVYDVQSNYYFPQGDDTNHGRDPWHAVATMSQAFKLLDADAGADYTKNRIVVMGFYHEYEGTNDKNYFMHSSWWEKNQARPTTISGAYGSYIKGGTLGLGFDILKSDGTTTGKPFDLYLEKPMRWENLTLFTYNTHDSNQNCLYAQNHDFILGKGVRLINFSALSSASGLAEGIKVPNFTIVAGYYDYMASSTAWSDPIGKMNGDYKIKYDGNENPNYTTIKILSGGFGRIIGASRNSGTKKVPALFGTPTNPNRVRIEINIQHEPGKEKEYLPDWNVLKSDGTQLATAPVSFTHDIGIVVGGQTDGSTFSDTEITIRNAHVARYVSGSITFGRPVTVYDSSYQLPDDAYFGRTVLNIYGGIFDEIYGGSLGRAGYGGENMVKAFFYGHSIINLYDGVLGNPNKKTDAKVFAAGAGGVIGKGSLWTVDGRSATDERKTYTSDDKIPFLKADGTIEFRAFDEDSPNASMPIMKCLDSNGNPYDLDLTESTVELNLYGGTIYGNVYGGGYGYANNLTYNRVPYRKLTEAKELQCIAGNLYGTSYVRLRPNPYDLPDVVIYGNVYGAGAGVGEGKYIGEDGKEYKYYLTEAAGKTKTIDGVEYTYNFEEVAKSFGDMHVIIEAGHVMGDVFGGGCGVEKYGEMANIYGNANLEIKGGIIDGNIYGGAAFSDIRSYNFTNTSNEPERGGGNANTKIAGGIIGNCIFGGGMGKFVAVDSESNAASNIYGDVNLVISGGSFSEEPYIITSDEGQKSKPFNIYGGGYINGTIGGNTKVTINSSLLKSTASIDRDFSEAWNDILDRRFCVYGAGYGEYTRVEKNTDVVIDIKSTGTTVMPTINNISNLVPGQTIFDVAGGGYNGNVGYWVDKEGNAIYKKSSPKNVEDYDKYKGGKLNVTVKGYPFIRKVIGGSFYAECNNTNTHIESGSIKEVYGGALMGYVHDHANLDIGLKAQDIVGNLSVGFESDVVADAATAAESNSRLFITGNVYGGNDVKGIVGTTFWTSDVPGTNFGKRGADAADGAPLFCSDVDPALNKGVSLFIHGGTIVGNVYGAGNGHYRGYYVPDWVRYNDGPARHYRNVRLIKSSPEDTEEKFGKVYRCRPMTGSVTMHIGGNSASDRVNILGNLYGGGRSCTIGQWNTMLPYEDPRRLVKAGFLHINFGSHVNVHSVYMGAQGDDFMRPKELKCSGLVIGDDQFPSTLDLDDLGEVAYDHWYLNADKTKYLPGFPAPGEVDGNFGMLGAHMLRAYAKNIEMNADIELTFYANPFKLNGNEPVMSADGTTVVCKKWLPAELAHTSYDASDVTFTNFFGGGASGFMTNNKLMRYNYTKEQPVQDITYTYYNNSTGYGVNYDYHDGGTDTIENFGTIYRYTLPTGLTVLDKVIGGSEDAIESTRGYEVNADETITFTDDVYYTFEGGMVTQCSYSYDLIVHNDKYYEGYKNNLDHAIPAEHFAKNYESPYTLQHGPDAGKTIYRWRPIEISDEMKENNPNYNNLVGQSRYDLAYYLDGTTKLAYCGPRENRIDGNKTVLKLTVACKFDPQEGESVALAPSVSSGEYDKLFGGVIYGGCYNSGVTQGDVMVSVSSNTIGDRLDVNNSEAYGPISSLAHNVGRVFGGGYGSDSRVDGDTYVNLILNFVGMNVFGGGCRGNVNGTTHVKYVGDENNSYVLGAIYGGSLYGSVGIQTEGSTKGTPVATDVRLFSGNADKVYGGSCLGNLYGRTNVELCDEVTTELQYFDYNKLLANHDIDAWGTSRLIVGSVFGGNDVSGEITPQPEIIDPEATGYKETDQYATYIHSYETPHVSLGSSDTGKQTPGYKGAYNGYPLIGYLFAGSNGNYGKHEVDGDGNDVYVKDGDDTPTFTIATGEGNKVMRLKLSGEDGGGGSAVNAYKIPNVTCAYLDIQGGTIVNAFGGGDCATITQDTKINVNYDPDKDIIDARAGFASDADFVRTWNTCHLAHTDQIDEVTEMRSDGSGGYNRVFRYHIFSLFGGNDKADMDIQPTWNLVSGHLGNIYSGGNFGGMTYFKKETIVDGESTTTKNIGLTLKLDKPNLHADAVFGGGRVGDIKPNIAKGGYTEATFNDDDFYGATLNIIDGVIDHVYGGNDVSGNVKYGTRVNIEGAISGDVYCAGNGNYRYKYDPSITDEYIAEKFDSDYGGRYFVLPKLSGYGDDTPTGNQKLQAINTYRPNVERAYLSVAGKDAENMAFVRGNVFCGGNSSTVNDVSGNSTIKFEIGNNVVLNGVFLGSDGQSLADPTMMAITEDLNEIDLSSSSGSGHLLDTYMAAVDVNSLPKNFKLDKDLNNAFIGSFYVGGNHGSMLTNKTIGLTFPYNLVIFNRIVGGSNSANVTYKGITHVGGLTTPLSTEVGADGKPLYTDKVYLQVRSQFRPLCIKYIEDARKVVLIPDMDIIDGDLFFPEGKCNIFGGCYSSGKTVGNIHIDLYSDLVKEYTAAELAEDIENIKTYFSAAELEGLKDFKDLHYSKERIIVNGIDKLQRRSFALVGGGYGVNTEVRGDIKLHMLPGQFHPDYWTKDAADKFIKASGDDSPSAGTVFGGSEQGLVVGNTEIAVRDGMVLSNLYGGSEASVMYGSTQIIIGWPQYYVCQQSGVYTLNRTDNISKAAKNDWKNSDNASKLAVLKTISVKKGEYISVNLYQTLNSTWQNETYFKLVADDTPQDYAAHNNSGYVTFHNITWDDIDIYIGNGNSRKDSRSEYFAHGNIYGGGFITANSNTSLAGQYSVRKFTNDYNNDANDVGYGGNSSIMIWDNIENRNPKNAVGGQANYSGDLTSDAGSGSKAIIKDHITIGAGHYTPVKAWAGMDIIGKYIFEASATGRAFLYTEEKDPVTGETTTVAKRGNYVHQSSYIVTAADLATGGKYENTTFYEIESDGGIYGGGRKVYVEGFRNCDLAYYGYADYCPQYPKLLNSAQRLDLFTITDCCLFFEGANDFATNSFDATRYSLTRIGELKMVSSIDKNVSLEPGERSDESHLFNTIHLKNRSRNYVGLFRDVLYVAAFTSSEEFSNPFRGANGTLYSVEDYAIQKTDAEGNPIADNKVNNKGSLPTAATYENTSGKVSDSNFYEHLSPTFTYKDYKLNRIRNYYTNRNLPSEGSTFTSEELEDNGKIRTYTKLEFDQRNLGTAANMIGINNGYTLVILGAVVGEGNKDNKYYGPVTGVFEVKLMTLSPDEGGGYIYALNYHDTPQNFLESTGNFVFPGAAYRESSESKYNYVYDDCFPMGSGWDSYYKWNSSSTYQPPTSSAPSAPELFTRAGDGGSGSSDHGDCNDEQEVHYWYVNGTKFYYNVTLTAFTSNSPQQFALDNDNELIYLYGVEQGSDISLKNVTWQPIATSASYQSDLQDLAKADVAQEYYDKDYRLYVTIDKYASKYHDVNSSESANSYVQMLPRADYSSTPTPTSADALALATSQVKNNYIDNSANENKPLLGISLQDNMDNSGSAYYNKHLSQDENVRFELSSQKSAGPTYTYVVNLNIRYLLGPTVSGRPVIENCALPGEYIFANDYGVNVDLDDGNMAVTAHKWYITDPSGEHKVELNSNTLGHGDSQIYIPAYLYRDGWKLNYEIVANGTSFPVSFDKSELKVHNYHRMKPMVPMTSTVEDLKLSAGAWIYIEDDEDMAYFYKWLSGLQSAGCESTVDGVKINPRYAEGLIVQLMTDVKMPASASATGLKFMGTFHGNGHNIYMGNNTLFLDDNSGTFYNTGFVSSLKTSDATVFGENNGEVNSCFFYNDENVAKGKMVGTNNQSFYNCYTSSGSTIDGLTQTSPDDFRYGRVAYNLNLYYLDKRYNLHESITTDVEPVATKFRKGEYRYGGVHSDDYPFLLRTAVAPNYHDYLGLRINATPDEVASRAVLGTVATMHDTNEPIDEERAVKVGEEVDHYQPLFPSDYLFFGQDLSYGSADLYPHAAYTTNRVYRASGFYGSKRDEGFHFNKDVEVLHPGLTAVDFSGIRDAQHSNTYTKELTAYDNSDSQQTVWYAPQLDLPVADMAGCTFDVGSRLQEEHTGSIPETHVTRNLLAYRKADTYGETFKYNTSKPYEQVYCHVIDVPDPTDLTTQPPNADYVQLVDKEDFNAPIAFDVNETIWYRRSPALWADNANGWEGICLPFTANITYGSVASREVDSPKNHGLMTHFYGVLDNDKPEDNNTGYWTRQTHEYWLRKFTKTDGTKAYFDRPASKADTDALNREEVKYNSYHYTNDYFVNAYGNLRYYEGVITNHVPDAYTSTGTEYKDYPLLTANYPYLVSFPGERYYEFDCSGNFYSKRTGNGEPDPQIITFAWDKAKAESAGEKMTVGVSDDEMREFEHDGKVFVGTFTHHTATAADIVVNIKDKASTLAHPATDEEKIVLPFRAYMRNKSGGSSPLKISTSGINEYKAESQEEDSDLSLQIYLDGSTLVIDNPYDYQLSSPICDIAGRVIRIIEIAPGNNRYDDLSRGFYLLERFKFYIP